MVSKQKGKKNTDKFWLDDQEKTLRLAGLIYNELDRIITDLELRKDLLFKLWTKERDRVPLIKTLHSRYYDIGLDYLVLFPNKLARQIDEFYRELEDFIFYVSYTEDMPQTLNASFIAYTKGLKLKAEPLLEELKKLA
jgi:hypothetical protein